MNQEYHVTSLVVHVAPTAITHVEASLLSLVGTEIHAMTPEGKIVVTLEGDSQKSILDNVEAINALPSVLSASLIYHQVEPLEQESEETP